MKIQVLWITKRHGRDKEPAIRALSDEYAGRVSRFVTTSLRALPNEEEMLKLIATSRTPTFNVLLDSRGKQFSSDEFAQFLDAHQTRGTQQLLFVIGPADGFSDLALKSANQTLSLGKMTLPHELARVVLLEQLYRAFTILKGHPYHSGH